MSDISISFYLDYDQQSEYTTQLKVGTRTLNSKDILPLYEDYLDKKRIRYETEIQYFEDPQLQGTPINHSFQLDIAQLKQNTLNLRIVNCRKKLQRTFQEFKKEAKESIRELERKVDLLINKNYKGLIEEEQTDLTFMFSEPLASKTKPLKHSSVDFRNEIKGIVEGLQNNNQKANICFQISKLQTFATKINEGKPKILHISCHGTSDGYLQFEDIELGYVRFVSSQQLAAQLKSLIWVPRLIFINSCYSQKIIKPFLELKECYAVITVKQGAQISEKAAKTFSQEFYNRIFQANTIIDAFNRAKQRIKTSWLEACCCYRHQKHIDGCLMIKKQKQQIGVHDLYHSPIECECQNKDFHQHKGHCWWARDTLSQINKQYVKIQNGSQIKCIPEQVQKKFRQDPKNAYLKICCGCPETKEEEYNKYVIRCFQQQNLNKKIFKTAQIKNRFSIGHSQFFQSIKYKQNLCGRNKKRQELFKFVNSFKRIGVKGLLILNGDPGHKLAIFIKKALYYLKERNQFQNFYEVQLLSTTTLNQFKRKVNDETSINLFRETYESYRESKSLGDDDTDTTKSEEQCRRNETIIVFYDCDSLLANSRNEFLEQLKKMIKDMKIIITIEKQTFQEAKPFIQESINSQYRKDITIENFSEKIAAEYLYIGFKNNKIKKFPTLKQLENSSLFRQYKFLTIPKQLDLLIDQLSQQKVIKMGMIEDYLVSITDNNKQLKDYGKIIEQNLQKLSSISKDTYDFLIFISLFSEGLSFDELDIFVRLRKKSHLQKQIIPIEEEWKNSISIVQDYFGPSKIKCQRYFKVCSSAHQPEQYLGSSLVNQSEHFVKVGNIITIRELGSRIKKNFFLQSKDDRVMVKQDIQKYIWDQNNNIKIQYFKFIYAVFFSITIDVILNQLRSKYLEEDLMNYSSHSLSGIFNPQLRKIDPKEVMELNLLVDNLRKANAETYQEKKEGGEEYFFRFLKRHENNIYKIYKLKLSLNDILKENEKINEFVHLFFWSVQNLMLQIPTVMKLIHQKGYERIQDSILQSIDENNSIEQEQQKINQNSGRLALIQPGITFLNKVSLKFMLIDCHLKNPCKKNQREKLLNTLQSQINSDIEKFIEYVESNKKNPMVNIAKIKQACQWELKLCHLYLNWKQTKDWNKFAKYLSQFANSYRVASQKTYMMKSPDPIILGRLCLLLGINYHMFSEDTSKREPDIQHYCALAEHIFKKEKMVYLQFCAKLTQLNIRKNFMKQNSINSKEITQQFNRWIQLVRECYPVFTEKRIFLNKMESFEYFSRSLQSMKEMDWKSIENGIVFLRAFPLCTYEENKPIIKNLIRTNRFLKEQLLTGINQKVNVIPMNFSILTKERLDYDLLNLSKMMVIYCDFMDSQQNNSSYMLVQGPSMKQQRVKIDRDFILELEKNDPKAKIIIIIGQNLKRPFSILQKTHKSYPKQRPLYIMIDLHATTNLQIEGPYSTQKFDAYKNFINERAQLRSSAQKYISKFHELVLEKQIDNDRIKEIHELSKKAAKSKLSNENLIKFFIQENFDLVDTIRFQRSSYFDFSPHFFVSTNLDPMEKIAVWRDWEKIIEIFSYIQIHNKPFYINIYSEDKIKTTFVKEIAKIMIERQKFKYGAIYHFECSQIIRYNKSIEEYIIQTNLKKEENHEDSDYQLAQLPSYQYFVEARTSLNNTMILLDNFDYWFHNNEMVIQGDEEDNGMNRKVNNLNKKFMDALIERGANIIFVTSRKMDQIHGINIKNVCMKEPDQKYLDFYASNTFYGSRNLDPIKIKTDSAQSQSMQSLQKIGMISKDSIMKY